MALLTVKELKKVYSSRLGKVKYQALDSVEFTVENGEFVSIMGESGSGKTTLLSIVSSIDRATSGEVILDGKELTSIKEGKLAEFRRKYLGFVFQDFNLLDTLTVENNILLPLVLSEIPHETMMEKLKSVSHLLGVDELVGKYPYEISGGQKQKVAIARALITSPKLILADEPTGALDSKTASALLKVFMDVNRRGQTILMVTHSVQAASASNRVLFIKDGKVFHQLYRGNMQQEEFYDKILNSLAISL